MMMVLDDDDDDDETSGAFCVCVKVMDAQEGG